MCNIDCKYEGFNGKCIKQLHGIPENYKPKECKNDEIKSLNKNLRICIECNFYDNDETGNYCKLSNTIIHNPYSGCILNKKEY